MDHIQLIKALIVFGADVEIHNDLGETPGLIAARSSKGERELAEEVVIRGRVDDWEALLTYLLNVRLEIDDNIDNGTQSSKFALDGRYTWE